MREFILSFVLFITAFAAFMLLVAYTEQLKYNQLLHHNFMVRCVKVTSDLNACEKEFIETETKSL